MNIREKVARAICLADTTAPEPDASIYIAMKSAKAWEGRTGMATAAITAFLEAAAEQDWHMRPDEATQEMEAEMKRLVYDLFLDWNENQEQLRSVYPKILRALNSIMPEFEWDK